MYCTGGYDAKHAAAAVGGPHRWVVRKRLILTGMHACLLKYSHQRMLWPCWTVRRAPHVTLLQHGELRCNALCYIARRQPDSLAALVWVVWCDAHARHEDDVSIREVFSTDLSGPLTLSSYR